MDKCKRVTLRFVGERNLMAWPRNLLMRIANPFVRFLCKFFNSTWSQAIGITLMLYTFYLCLILYVPGASLLGFAVVVHLILWSVLRYLGRKGNNAKLLILRVFLLGKTSTFTFKNLASVWKHFGSYFTVADPSFYKVNWKQKFNINFPLYIILFFAFYTMVVDPNREIEGDIFLSFIFLLFAGNLLFVIFGRIQMKLKFMTTSEALDKRLSKLQRAPTFLDGTFRPDPVMCYDNTWKLAVDGLIDKSDVVLMDLRGFSENNKGCAYEVNVLFDSKPTHNIVFLAYEEAVPQVRELIKTQWAELSDQSPNLKIATPYTTLYTINKENSRDIEGVADALLSALGD
jgi:hypothetical protein